MSRSNEYQPKIIKIKRLRRLLLRVLSLKRRLFHQWPFNTQEQSQLHLPRMACAESCPLYLHRFHMTCVFCHLRRGRAAQHNPKHARHTPDGYSLKPRSYTTLFLAVDNNRRFRKIKDQLLKKVMVIAEVLAN